MTTRNKKLRIEPGLQWTDAKGRRWEVFEVLPFGRVVIRTTDRSRIGDVQTKSLRPTIEAALAKEGSAV